MRFIITAAQALAITSGTIALGMLIGYSIAESMNGPDHAQKAFHESRSRYSDSSEARR